MKKILLLCLTTLLSLLANGETVKCLVVVSVGGEKTNFALSEEPSIRFGAGTLTVSSADYTIEELPFSDFEKYYFADAIPTVDGIGSINTMEGSLPQFINGKVFITGLKNGTLVYIYTADGQAIGSVESSSDGNVCVDLGSLKSGGVYILRTPSTSFKIVK